MLNFPKYLILLLAFFSEASHTSISIREIQKTKKSVYVEHAIYQAGIDGVAGQVSGLRHARNSQRSFERLVLDFKGKKLPETYVFVSSKDGKVNIDLSSTSLRPTVKPHIKSNMIKEVNFFPLANDILSMEVYVDKNIYVEVFQLDSPTRLVIDFKK